MKNNEFNSIYDLHNKYEMYYQYFADAIIG